MLQLADVETPQPGRGEVRVRLLTSGVNPSDVKSRAGLTRKIAFPRVIPHSDGAGEIDAVGEGVSPDARRRARLGLERSVAASVRHRRRLDRAAVGTGGGACPPMSRWKPAPVSAFRPIPAIRPFCSHGAKEGSTVLVAAGAGAVGHYAIQFAKQRKATVITTVSSPAKAEIARQAGADHVIDYKREDVGERVMAITGKRGVDAVIEMDLAANARLLPNVLAPNGVVAIYGSGAAEASIPFQFLLQNSITLQFFLVYLMPPAERERATADITRMLERGELIHNVAQTFDLGDMVAAHEAVESGKAMGNIVVKLA